MLAPPKHGDSALQRPEYLLVPDSRHAIEIAVDNADRHRARLASRHRVRLAAPVGGSRNAGKAQDHPRRASDRKDDDGTHAASRSHGAHARPERSPRDRPDPQAPERQRAPPARPRSLPAEIDDSRFRDSDGREPFEHVFERSHRRVRSMSPECLAFGVPACALRAGASPRVASTRAPHRRIRPGPDRPVFPRCTSCALVSPRSAPSRARCHGTVWAAAPMP